MFSEIVSWINKMKNSLMNKRKFKINYIWKVYLKICIKTKYSKLFLLLKLFCFIKFLKLKYQKEITKNLLKKSNYYTFIL